MEIQVLQPLFKFILNIKEVSKLFFSKIIKPTKSIHKINSKFEDIKIEKSNCQEIN